MAEGEFAAWGLAAFGLCHSARYLTEWCAGAVAKANNTRLFRVFAVVGFGLYSLLIRVILLSSSFPLPCSSPMSL